MLTTAHAAKLARRTGGREGEGKEGRAFAKSDEEEEKRKVRGETATEDGRGERRSEGTRNKGGRASAMHL